MDDELKALYAENLNQYEIDYWTKKLVKSWESNELPFIVNVDEIQDHFAWNGIQPLGIPQVLEHLRKNRIIYYAGWFSYTLLSSIALKSALSKFNGIVTFDQIQQKLNLDQKNLQVFIDYASKFVSVEKDFLKTTGKITAIDHSILKLRKTLEKLQSQQQEIQLNIKKCLEQVMLKKKHYIIRKKRLEEMYELREKQIQNLHSMLDQIDHSVTDNEVLEAYKAGTNALKLLTPDISIIDEMLEVMADHKEIQKAMCVDETDYDSLLENLVKVPQHNLEPGTLIPN